MKIKMKYQLSRNIMGWLFMIPSIILFIFFVWHPLLNGLRFSFFNMKGFVPTQFVGLENYELLLKTVAFKDAFWNTLEYTFWSLIIGYLIPIIIAIFLNELIHFKGLIRLGIYFPNIVPAVVTLLMWKLLMSASDGGVLNAFFGKIGLGPFEWINNPKYVIPLIIITMTWRAFGSTVLIYMASLQSISQELYEAAAVDGAGMGVKIRHITIPSVLPLAKILLLLQFIAVFQVMQEPFLMTGGGPYRNASLSLLLLNYKYAFTSDKIEMAAAVGGLVSVMLLAISFVYLRVTRSREDE